MCACMNLSMCVRVCVLICEWVCLRVSSHLSMFICWICVCIHEYTLLSRIKDSSFKIEHNGIEKMEEAGWFFLSFPVSFVWEQDISPSCAKCLPFTREKGEECEQTDLFQFPARSLALDHFPCSTIPLHSSSILSTSISLGLRSWSLSCI